MTDHDKSVRRKQWVESEYPAFWTGFTPVPNSVLLNADLTALAVRVYVLLENIHRRRGNRMVEDPSMFDSAKQIGVSEPTFRKALKELVSAGLLVSKRRGQGMPNVMKLVPPGESQNERIFRSRPKKSTHPRARAILALSEEGDSPYGLSIGTSLSVQVPQTVNRSKVGEREAALAVDVLVEWNAQADQRLASPDWLKKIVMRCREHPELTAADHAHLIASTLASPWWSGPASPSVLYGNGAVFEKALMGLSGRNGPKPLTVVGQIREHAKRLREEGR